MANLISIAKEVESQGKGRFELKTISHQLPTAVPINNPLVEIISKHTESVPGRQAETERNVRRDGNKTTHPERHNRRRVWAGDEAEAHATNESISIKELVGFAEIMALITLDMLA